MIDGNWGFGYAVTDRAMRYTIEKAKTQNVAAATVFRQSHIGRLASYPLLAAAEGMIAMITADSGRSAKARRALSAAPRRGSAPTRSASPSRPTWTARWCSTWRPPPPPPARSTSPPRAANRCPTGWLIDAEGKPSTDPRVLKSGGALLPLGGTEGYKGTGLAAIVEILSGLLTGLGFGVEPTGRHNDGCFIAVFNVAAFRSLDTFKQEVTEFAQYLKATPPAQGFTEVFYPGEVEFKKEQDRRKNGVPIEDATWNKIRDLAQGYGLTDKLGL